MKSVIPQNIAEGRKRGPKRHFVGQRLRDLIEFMSDPNQSAKTAAKRFNCSERLIELTMQRLRQEMPDEAFDPASADPDAPSLFEELSA